MKYATPCTEIIEVENASLKWLIIWIHQVHSAKESENGKKRAKSKLYLLALNTMPNNVEVISVRMNERNEGETVNTDDDDNNNTWRRVNNSWFLLMDVCCVQKPQMDDTLVVFTCDNWDNKA